MLTQSSLLTVLRKAQIDTLPATAHQARTGMVRCSRQLPEELTLSEFAYMIRAYYQATPS